MPVLDGQLIQKANQTFIKVARTDGKDDHFDDEDDQHYDYQGNNKIIRWLKPTAKIVNDCSHTQKQRQKCSVYSIRLQLTHNISFNHFLITLGHLIGFMVMVTQLKPFTNNNFKKAMIIIIKLREWSPVGLNNCEPMPFNLQGVLPLHPHHHNHQPR